MDQKKLVKKIYIELKTKGLIKRIYNNSGIYYDEPKFFNFVAELNKNNIALLKITDQVGGGISFTSKYIALLRCLSECIERYCLFHHNNKLTSYSSYKGVKENALDLTVYDKNFPLHKKIGWVKGYNFTNGTLCLLPAQLIYLNYPLNNEPRLTTQVSTGAAAGVDHESTLLRSIYEIIERDSFMTIFLCKVNVPRIDVNSIKIKIIQQIIDSCKRYDLELFLFNITNDLEIPAFLSLLIDRTGIGPGILVGAKASLNIKEALLSSIEEVFMGRLWGRSEIIKRKSNNFTIKPTSINTRLKRMLFWSSPKMIKKIDYLIRQPTKILTITRNKNNYREELNYIKRKLFKKGFSIYFADITLDIFRKMNYFVYKAIIPGLQPLYLNEKEKELNLNRIESVSKYFNYKKEINQLPHPFL